MYIVAIEDGRPIVHVGVEANGGKILQNRFSVQFLLLSTFLTDFFRFSKSRKFRMFHSSVHYFVLVPGCCEGIKKISWIRTKLFQGSTFLSLHIFKRPKKSQNPYPPYNYGSKSTTRNNSM